MPADFRFLDVPTNINTWNYSGWKVNDKNETKVPNAISSSYPNAKFVKVYSFDKSISIKTTPIYIGVAMLPPRDN